MVSLVCVAVLFWTAAALATDLDQIRTRGVLRHLAVPYARFVTGSGDGLDVELIQRFAQDLGVAYESVPTSWEQGIGDLTGRNVRTGALVPVKGDLLANGLTILEWRKKIVTFSVPTFVSQIWIAARADLPLSPILPQAEDREDIRQVLSLVRGHTVLGMARTCLDPELYAVAPVLIRYFQGALNELVPALLNKEAELVLQDAPDALVALGKWPGQVKILGPVSLPQYMGVAMDQNSGSLKQAFDQFFGKLWRQGQYQAMVEKYYPGYTAYFPGFFNAPAPPSSDGDGL